MHVNATGKKKKWIWAPIAGVLTASIIGSAIYSSSTEALAKASLPGIEKIVTANDKSEPFRILEIVPSYTDASIGFLVDGEEPVDTTNAQGRNDMAYKEELAVRYNEPATGDFDAYDALKDKALKWDGAFDTTATTLPKKYTAYGQFVKDVGNGQYIEISPSAVYEVVKDVEASSQATIEEVLNRTNDKTDQTGQLYLDYAYYANPDLTNDEYVLEFVEYQTLISKDKIAPYVVYNDGTYDYYNEQYYTVGTEITTSYDENGVIDGVVQTIPNGTVLYERSSQKLIPVCIIKEDPLDNTKQVVYFFSNPGTGYVLNSTQDLVYLGGLIDGHHDLVTVKPKASDDGGVAYVIGTSTNPTVSANDPVLFANTSADWNELKGIGFNIKLSPKSLVESDKVTVGDTQHRYFYKLSNKDPYEYAGPGKDYRFEHDFAQGAVKEFEYAGGFTNYEWFKQYVMDREAGQECSDLYVDVTTKKLNEVSEEDIKNADLIYFRGGDYTPTVAGCDFANEKVAVTLLAQIYNENKAVAMEYSTYICCLTGTPGEAFNTQLGKVASVLMYCTDDEDNMDLITSYADLDKLEWKTTLDQAGCQVVEDLYKDPTKFASRACKSVYINNDYNTAGTAVDLTKKIVAADFATKMASSAGFKAVEDDINEEVFFLQIANSTATFNSELSKATVLRYILNYGNRRAVTKTALRILDIEPYYARTDNGVSNNANPAYSKLINVWNASENQNVTVGTALTRDTFDKEWFVETIATQYAENAEDIEMINVGTHEFVGRIEDLNTNYDLIYIGLDTAYMNTTITKDGDKYTKTTNTIYNDTSKNGLVYTHIGDAMSVASFETSENGRESGVWNASGNDITPDKFRELKEYVQAGYAVILSNDAVRLQDGVRVPNNYKIDSTSYMYKFIDFCLNGDDSNGKTGYYGKNVFLKADFDDAAEGKLTATSASDNITNFTKYLNISKLEIEVQKDATTGEDLLPVPYYSTYKLSDGTLAEGYRYIEKDGQIYNLRYVVKLKNDAAVDTTKTSYDCKLYIDSDADGRFEDIEVLKGLTISEVDGFGNVGSEVYKTSDGNHEYYELKTGIIYEVKRQVPEGYKGFLSWKLEFIENGREAANNLNKDSENSRNLVRRAIEGSCAVPDYSDKPTIKVLQLTSGGSTGTELDLDEPAMHNLYYQVKDFTIDVTKVPINDLVNQTGIFAAKPDRYDVLTDYNMLVMGFIDMYRIADVNGTPDGQNEKSLDATFAIREYILSGRSMLFTHDLNSTRYKYANAGSETWGYWFNNYLRDLQGMDRFGLVKNNLVGKTYNGSALTEYKSVYDTYTTDFNVTASYSNAVTAGFNNPSMLRWRQNNKLGEMAYAGNNALNFDNDYVYNRVARVNSGQITQYPFNIPETITVANTHPQYMQLNLQTDYTDDNTDDDIVVWYCISNNGYKTNGQRETNETYYELNYNDTINNYYIYNKGNITYTGSGHRTIGTGFEDERKLFVNTLVAAYNSGTKEPVVYYKQNTTSKDSPNITSLYVPYDLTVAAENGTTNGWLEPTIDVNFKAVSLDLKKSKDNIIAKYYIEANASTPGAVKIGKKYYKEITPVAGSVKKVSFRTKVPETVDADPYNLENQETYTMKFRISDLMGTAGVNSLHNVTIVVRTKNIGKEEVSVFDGKGEGFSELNVNFTELYDLR